MSNPTPALLTDDPVAAQLRELSREIERVSGGGFRGLNTGANLGAVDLVDLRAPYRVYVVSISSLGIELRREQDNAGPDAVLEAATRGMRQTCELLLTQWEEETAHA